MPGSAAKVVITERQQVVLRKMSTATTVAQRLVQRATIILLAFAGLTNEAIAAQVGLERHQIGLWRRRWQRAFNDLVRIECTEDAPAALRHAIEGVLTDEPRPGSPGKFTAEQITLLFALACEPPGNSGLPITHWTGAELAAAAVQRGLVESISASQVNRLLREAHLQPHRSRYWLNTREKDPERFEAQVAIVCACYHDAPQLYSHHDTHTICVDEMTGIQALERIATTLAMKPGQSERREFEYQRHGTLTLIGNFHVVLGELIAPTLGPTRTEADFATHIEQTIDLDPEARYVFVLDNLNTHCSATLVELVARRCGITDDLGQKGKRGVLKSMKSRQEFLVEQSHRIRLVYTPKHSSWLNQIEIVFGVIMRKVVRRGSFTSVEDLRTKLLAFIDYFNQVFAKPFKWTYTGRPLQA
jgi:transposase